MKRGEFESVAAAAREVVNQLARQAARKRMGRSALDENFGEVIKAVFSGTPASEALTPKIRRQKVDNDAVYHLSVTL